MKKSSKGSVKGKTAKNYSPTDPNLGSLTSGMFPMASMSHSNPLSMPFGLALSNAYMPITLNRVLVSYSYMTHGVLQTMIDQPVEDAFRGGLIIKSDELSPEDVKDLQDYLEQNNVLKEIKDVMRWAKLYGGAGLVINTDQDPQEELDVDLIGENSPLSFFAADRWELTLNFLQSEEMPCPYSYYGQKIHKTRIVKVMGKEAPSYVRKRLQGWGMSEIERVLRPLTSYVKNEDLIYELLDEAKVDIYKIMGFNTNVFSKKAQAVVDERLQMATMIKNYHNAVVMDTNDEYDQKQLSFSGLPDMLKENRIGMAAAVRMPMSKLFGLSAQGFASGEDDIENYNALIESEVRAKAKEILHEVLPLCCQQMFGFIPDNLNFEFHPLRVLSAEQEESVKTTKFNRLSSLYSQGILSPQEFCEALKEENIFAMDTEVSKGAEPTMPEGQLPSFPTPQDQAKEKKAPAGDGL